MTQKTNAFSQSQKPKWTDGQLANGSNFAQLIDAIASLVDETATETLTQAAANATSAAVGDDHIKAIAKSILDTAADYNTTGIWAKLTERINSKATPADIRGLFAPVIPATDKEARADSIKPSTSSS